MHGNVQVIVSVLLYKISTMPNTSSMCRNHYVMSSRSTNWLTYDDYRRKRDSYMQVKG